MRAPLSPEDRDLLRHGVERGADPVGRAVFALLRARVEELVEALVRSEGPDETRRLQGAVRELRRWADYPGELARRARMEEEEDGGEAEGSGGALRLP